MGVAPEVGMWDPAEGADLRRKHRRELVEAVLQASPYLPDQDRALLEAFYRDGRPVAELAALAGCTPRVIRRRIRTLVARVLSPRFAFVAHHEPRWSPTRRRVARACVLGGRSLREAADDLALSLHTVRRHHDAINALFETLARGARA